jgi:type IX secretion system substrate protein
VGRVNQLAFSATHANVMYAVAPAGLFISVDTGQSWHSTITDYMGYHSFKSIAIDPANDSIIYLGYGDYALSLGYIYDTGVMKSVDFGNSFTSLTNGMDSVVINAIQINPFNNSHIVAGGINGIWKSTDAGLSWQHTYIMFDSLNAGHFIYDIKFKPNSSDTLYATTESEFLISTDGGSSWNTGFSNFQFTATLARELLLGVTPAAPDYVYIASTQDFGNIYKSTDGGATFTATKHYASPGLTGYDTLIGSYGQGFYDFTFYADPFDSLKLYIGSISVYSSSDGGVTWSTPYKDWYQYADVFNLHPDQHYIARNPLLPGMLWVTNDGGIYSKADTDSAYSAKHDNLAITQAFHFDADNFYDSTFAIGTQDNGASYTNNGNDFTAYKAGDMYARIYCAYNNSAAIYTSGSNFGGSATNIDIHNPPVSYPFNIPESGMQEPMSLTPVDPLTAFVANNDIWETNDMNGTPVNWRKIFDNTSPNVFIAANHCLADTTIFYAVRGDGFLFRTFDALDIQPVFDSVVLPMLTVNYIATVPNNTNIIYLCNYTSVYISNDKGLTWTDITAPLNPLFGFQEIVADPFAADGSVYLLATNKVYYKNDTSAWIDYSNQLPDVTYINDISVKKYSSQVRKVWVSVYGRSIWQSPVYQSLVTNTTEHNLPENQISVFPIPSSGYVTVETNSDNLKIDRITIYNAQGQPISASRKAIGKSRLNLSVSKLPDGIYFMEINTNEGVSMKRIVIVK